MAIAEGRTIPFTGPETVDVAVLETFEYAGPEQEIITETREFSPVCPYSGLPDFATLRIVYVPGDRCVELKSLKYYVASYRSVGIFQEHVNVIWTEVANGDCVRQNEPPGGTALT